MSQRKFTEEEEQKIYQRHKTEKIGITRLSVLYKCAESTMYRVIYRQELKEAGLID